MALADRVQELNREIGAAVERALADLRREMAERLRSGSEEVLRRLDDLTPTLPSSYVASETLAPVTAELETATRQGVLGELRDAFQTIDRARTQSEILHALLGAASRCASRTALLLTRGGEVRGFAGRGFGSSDEAVRGIALPAAGVSAWARLAAGQGAVRLNAAECAAVVGGLECALPDEGVMVPLVLRDKVAAALYADRVGGDELSIPALQILTYAAAQAIESLPFRERSSTPTLVLDEPSAAGGLGFWPPAPAPAQPAAPKAPPPAAVEVKPPPVAVPPEPAPVTAFAIPVAEPEPPTFEAHLPEVEAELPEVEAEPVEAWAPPVAAPPPSAATTSPALTEELPAYIEKPAAPAVPEPTAPVRLPSPEATVLLDRAALQEAMAAPPSPAPPETSPAAAAPPPPTPAPVPEPPVAGFDAMRTSPLVAVSAEVRPPAGIDGPGFAFATTRVQVSASDEALHEEARRLARLLVSEIKLYNEEQVDEGRRSRDIYERLKEDIDRSRQMYEERVEPRILRSTDYFYQELVRILAAGDSKALGI
jgi:hypothetical protein